MTMGLPFRGMAGAEWSGYVGSDGAPDLALWGWVGLMVRTCEMGLSVGLGGPAARVSRAWPGPPPTPDGRRSARPTGKWVPQANS